MFAVFLKLKTLTYKSIYKLSQSISQKLGTEYQMSIEFSDRGIKKKKKNKALFIWNGFIGSWFYD